MKKVLITLLSIVLAVCFSVPAVADSPATDSFTHLTLADGSSKTVVTRPLYKAVESIDSRSLGIEKFGTIKDVKCDSQGNIYILTENSEIIVLDSNYSYVRNFSVVDDSGNQVNFDGATGFYIESPQSIYIADANNARVIWCVDGVVKKEIKMPDSELIPSDFSYRPTRVIKDSKGYLYVLSEGSYYGALLFDSDLSFVGFYGSNTVKGTILTTLSYVWDTLTQNDIKRAKKAKTLPYQFVDICIDSDDFVYTCTGKNADGAVGQIRMLSPGGSNILAGSESKNFGETDKVTRHNKTMVQNFTSIAADGKGFIYALDVSYGFLYVYDTKCNLITAFGGGIGNGKQTGVFSAACAMTVCGSKVIVADSLKNSLTVFDRTEYGKTVFEAQQISLNSDYKTARPLWEKVLEKDAFNRLALTGIAKAAYDSKDYKLSMEYAKKANDVTTYGQALKEVQNEFISKNWTWIFLLVLILIGGLIAVVIISVKRKLVLIKNPKVNVMFNAMIHPFNSFKDIKYKKQGSMLLAVIMTLLFFVTSVMRATLSDFRYTTFDASTYNSLMELARTVGLVALWSVANWAVCILMQGRGTLKEVFVVTSYATLPIILYNIISIPISYVITSSDSTLISGLNTLAIIITGIMLCVGLMIIHDLSFTRIIVSSIITVIFMILIIFVLFMIGVLLSQFWNFVTSIILEAVRWQ